MNYDGLRKPCPFCGANSPGDVEPIEVSNLPPRSMALRAVECRRCGATGPSRAVDNDAVAAWNVRMGPIARPASPPECSTCVFFERYTAVKGQPLSGTCHRYPKPYVRVSSHWCGEWKERP